MFQGRLNQALQQQAAVDLLIDEILEIADDSSHDFLVNEQGTTVCNNELIARSRLRIDTRKWLASKLVPKVYGVHQKDNGNIPSPTLIEMLIDKIALV